MARGAGPVIAWLLLRAAICAPCPTDAADSLERASGQVELAYVMRDTADVAVTTIAMGAALPCLDRLLGVSEVVQLHRATALGAFTAGDGLLAEGAFAAVHQLDPSWVPPQGMMPRGDPLAAAWGAATQRPARRSPLPDLGLTWVVDGAAVSDAPAGRPFVVQALGGSQRVLWSQYALSVDDVPRVVRDRAAARRGGLLVGLGAGASAIGGGLSAWGLASGVAAVERANASRTTLSYEAALDLRRASVGRLVSGEVLAGAGTAAVIAGVVTLAGSAHRAH